MKAQTGYMRLGMSHVLAKAWTRRVECAETTSAVRSRHRKKFSIIVSKYGGFGAQPRPPHHMSRNAEAAQSYGLGSEVMTICPQIKGRGMSR